MGLIHRTVSKLLAAVLLLLPRQAWGDTVYPDCVNGPLATNIVCNKTASPSARAIGLVAAMTLNEKLANLVNSARGAPRLGLAPYEWWSEALHGVAYSPGVTFNRSGGLPVPFWSATSFANPILLSASFDDTLVQAVATQIGVEARAFANAGLAGLDFWTPNVNPYKDPRWGRGMETPGEDVLRITRYAEALLRGLEGDDKEEGKRKVIATCKHFVGNDLDRWNGVKRYSFDAVVTLQDLAEYYLPPFRQCARDSNVGSIMCAYNAISIKGWTNLTSNGTPSCGSRYLLGDILRDHWGWKGHSNYVTSDCNAVMNFWNDHKWSSTPAHAAGAAISAGTDTICEVPGYPASDITGAYEQGLLDVATVDRALWRLFEGLVRVGYFDGPPSLGGAGQYAALKWEDVNTPLARELALRSAVEGMVLKKNEGGILPLRWLQGEGSGAEEVGNKAKQVALVGHWADDGAQMLGGYTGLPPYINTPATVASRLVGTGNNFQVLLFDGGPVNQAADVTGTADDTWTVPAMEIAAQADVVLYFGGLDMSIESEDRDRLSLAWPGAQLRLIERLASLGKPTVVVQLGNQADDTPLLSNKNVSAVLWAGYPGQEGGTAVFDVLSGRTAPAGRLPVTQYPAGYADAVPMTDMGLRRDVTSGGGNPGRTYRWFADAVLPFGFGLHYTTFEAALSLGLGAGTAYISTSDIVAYCTAATNGSSAPRFIDRCASPLALEVAVTNTGKEVTSDFVALVFARGEFGPAPFPIKTLVGYTRLRDIPPGKTARQGVLVEVGSLARTVENGDLVLYPGRYELVVDVDVRNKGTGTGAGTGTVGFEIVGQTVVLDRFPQPKV